jgi:hypothetical protein
MTLEEKFKEYLERIEKGLSLGIASDLAQIAEEGREVIANGEIVFWLDGEIICNIFVNQWGKKEFNLLSIADFIPKKDWKKYKGKKVKLTLEVIE